MPSLEGIAKQMACVVKAVHIEIIEDSLHCLAARPCLNAEPHATPPAHTHASAVARAAVPRCSTDSCSQVTLHTRICLGAGAL